MKKTDETRPKPVAVCYSEGMGTANETKTELHIVEDIVLEMGGGIDGTFYEAVRAVRNEWPAHRLVDMVVAGSGLAADLVWDGIMTAVDRG